MCFYHDYSCESGHVAILDSILSKAGSSAQAGSPAYRRLYTPSYNISIRFHEEQTQNLIYIVVRKGTIFSHAQPQLFVISTTHTCIQRITTNERLITSSVCLCSYLYVLQMRWFWHMVRYGLWTGWRKDSVLDTILLAFPTHTRLLHETQSCSTSTKNNQN